MPDILGEIRKDASNGRAMLGEKKELKFKLFKIACQREETLGTSKEKMGRSGKR